MQISDEIRETVESAAEGEAWMHGYTYSGHATACAVALKNLEIIEAEKLVERARLMGQRLLDGLKKLEEFPFVGEVRGLGLICGVEIVTDKESRQPDPALAARIFKEAQARGLRSRPLGNTLAFSPPLIINEAEVDEIVQRLGAAMDAMRV
jgi:adenosylmethionine-8-amino-7-oxononanoate aminotransferase